MANAHLLTDVRTRAPAPRAAPRVRGRDRATPRRDAAAHRWRSPTSRTIDGRDNLGQAVIVRLLTPRGELAPLAHPDYGSRLHELIGRQNTETTRNLVKLHVLESLAAEPRIEEVVELDRHAGPAHARARGRAAAGAAGRRDAPSSTIGPFTLELAS